MKNIKYKCLICKKDGASQSFSESMTGLHLSQSHDFDINMIDMVKVMDFLFEEKL